MFMFLDALIRRSVSSMLVIRTSVIPIQTYCISRAFIRKLEDRGWVDGSPRTTRSPGGRFGMSIQLRVSPADAAVDAR